MRGITHLRAVIPPRRCIFGITVQLHFREVAYCTFTVFHADERASRASRPVAPERAGSWLGRRESVSHYPGTVCVLGVSPRVSCADISSVTDFRELEHSSSLFPPLFLPPLKTILPIKNHCSSLIIVFHSSSAKFISNLKCWPTKSNQHQAQRVESRRFILYHT